MKPNGNILPIPLEVSSFIIFLLRTSIYLVWKKNDLCEFLFTTKHQTYEITRKMTKNVIFSSKLLPFNFSLTPLKLSLPSPWIAFSLLTLLSISSLSNSQKSYPAVFGNWRKTFLKSFNSSLRISMILCLLVLQ